jgi:hypothetical protein
LLQQLVSVRQRQAEIWEEQLALETRVVCKFLPPHFDQLQRFIVPLSYVPLNDQAKVLQLKQKHDKIIQEAKRSWLALLFAAYETRLQHHDDHYQHVFTQLDSLLLTGTDEADGRTRSNQVQQYMTHHTDQLLKAVRQRNMSFRMKVLHRHQYSSVGKRMIGVSPEPFLDLACNPFTANEWNYLSLGKTVRMQCVTLACARSILHSIESECHSISERTKDSNRQSTSGHLRQSRKTSVRTTAYTENSTDHETIRRPTARLFESVLLCADTLQRSIAGTRARTSRSSYS